MDLLILLKELSMVELLSHANPKRRRSSMSSIPRSTAQVVEIISDRIRKREAGYEPGDKLPTYDELVAKLPASRATVQRAMRQLKVAGWVVGLGGGGTYVAERPPVS